MYYPLSSARETLMKTNMYIIPRTKYIMVSQASITSVMKETMVCPVAPHCQHSATMAEILDDF